MILLITIIGIFFALKLGDGALSMSSKQDVANKAINITSSKVKVEHGGSNGKF